MPLTPIKDRQALGTLSPNRSPVRVVGEALPDKAATAASPYSAKTFNKLVQKPQINKSATKKALTPTKSPKGKTPVQARTIRGTGALTPTRKAPASTQATIHIHSDDADASAVQLSPKRAASTVAASTAAAASAEQVQNKENASEGMYQHTCTPSSASSSSSGTSAPRTPSTSSRFLAKAMGTPLPTAPQLAAETATEAEAEAAPVRSASTAAAAEETNAGERDEKDVVPPLPCEVAVLYGNSKAGKRAGLSSNAYEVTFPPGPMGLELEPVIISATKQIGCRVRDFYFGVDFDKVALVKLKETVKIGDVLSHLNGQSVLSLPFQEVLGQLRRGKEQARVVVFKNLAAVPESTVGNFKRSPDNTPVKADVEAASGTMPAARDVASSGADAGPGPADVSTALPQHSHKDKGSPAALLRGLVAASADSPGMSGWKVYPGTPQLTPSVNKASSAAEAETAGALGVAGEKDEADAATHSSSSSSSRDISHPIMATATAAATDAQQRAQARHVNTSSGLTISPVAVRALRYDVTNADDMAAYYYHAASPTEKGTAGSGSVNPGIASITKRVLSRAAAPAVPASQVVNADTTVANRSVNLNRVLRTLGSSIGDVLGFGMTSVVGDKILGAAGGGGSGGNSLTPEQQIHGLINLKHELVTELSKTCVMLGAAEDAQGGLQAQLEASKSEQLQLRKAHFLLEEKVAVLQDQLSAAQSRVETASHAEMEGKDAAHAAELAAVEESSAAAVSTLQASLDQERTEHNMWQAKHAELHTLHQELQRQCIREQEETRDQRAETRLVKQQAEEQVGELRARLEAQAQERAAERAAWEAEAESMAQEQALLQEEIKCTFATAAETLAAVEEQRDVLQAEVEVLRDVGSSELTVKCEEVARLKAQLATQHHEYKEVTVKSQADAAEALDAAQLELAAAQKLLSAQKNSGDSLVAELEKQLQASKDSLQETTRRVQDMEQQCVALTAELTAANTDVSANKQLVQELLLQQRIDEDSFESYRNKLQAAEDALTEQSLTYSTNFLAASNEIGQLREALLEATDLTMSIQAQLDKSEAENLQTSIALRTALDSREQQYSTTLEECQSTIDTLTQDSKLLTDKISQSEQKLLLQLQETEKAEVMLVERTAERDAANELSASLSAELADTQEMARTNHSNSNTKLLTALAEITLLETRVNEEAAQYYTMLSERDSKIDAAEDCVTALKSAEMALNTRLEESVEEYEQCLAKLEASRQRVAQAAADAEAKESEALSVKSALEENMSVLETQLLEACAERDAILEISDAESQEASALILQLKTKLTELAGCYDSALSDLQAVRTELADVRTLAEVTATQYQEGMKTLTEDLTTKFHAKVTALREQMEQQSQQFAKQEEDFKLQLADTQANALVMAAQAESEFSTVSQTAQEQAELLLKQTFTRAVEAERLLQVAYDDNQELLEQTRVAEFSEKKAEEKCVQYKHSIALKEEEAAAVVLKFEEQLEEKKCEVQDLQFSLLQLRSEYSAVCDDAVSLEKRLVAAEPFKKRAELLQDQLKNVTLQLTSTIHERDEIATTAQDMTKAHEHVRREVQGLLASQEETMAAFDAERTGLKDDMHRAQEHWQMVAEAQLAKQMQIFDKQLAESTEQYDHKLASSTKEFVEKLDVLNIKLHEKQAALVTCRKDLVELRDDIVPTLNAENESLTVTCETLKSECTALEDKCDTTSAEMRAALLQHTQELCTATEEFASREQTLLRQRTEIMDSLQQQHEHLSATIQDRDNAVETLREQVVELETYISGQKDARKQEKEDMQQVAQNQDKQVNQLTNELANLHAQINRMLHTADLKDTKDKSAASADVPAGSASGPWGLSLSSMDLAARLEGTLAETKAMLVTSAADCKGLKAANVALVETVEQQGESMSASISRVQELEELLSQNEDMQKQQQMLIANQQRRLKSMQSAHEAVIAERCAEASDAMQHRHAAIVDELNKSLREISASMAAAKSDALQTRQTLLNKEAELDAMRDQCAQLTIAGAQAAHRSPLTELDQKLHDDRAGGVSCDVIKVTTEDIDSSLSDDHIALSAHNPNHMEWHDHLINLSLDMHEALTFSILEHRRNTNQQHQEVATEADQAVGKCLTAASFCTQALHSHIMRTPWSSAASDEPIPVLPAAHEMLFALGVTERSSGEENKGSFQDTNDENATPSASTNGVAGAGIDTAAQKGSVMDADATNTPSFVNQLFDSQLMRRLTEAMQHCNAQEKALVQVNKEMEILKKKAAQAKSEHQQQQQQQQEQEGSAPIARSDGNKTSEHVYLLLEELAAHLKETSHGSSDIRNSNGTAAAGAAGSENIEAAEEPGSGGSSANNSVSYENDRALWKSLCTVANQALQNYQTRVFVRATSESSRADRYTDLDSSSARDTQQTKDAREAQGLVDRCEYGDSVLSSSINSLMAMQQQNSNKQVRESSNTHNITKLPTYVHAQHKTQSTTRDLNLEDIVALAELDASFGDNDENHYHDEYDGFHTIGGPDLDMNGEEVDIGEAGRGQQGMGHMVGRDMRDMRHLTGLIIPGGGEGSEQDGSVDLGEGGKHDESGFWNLSADNINVHSTAGDGSGGATEVNSSVDSLICEGL